MTKATPKERGPHTRKRAKQDLSTKKRLSNTGKDDSFWAKVLEDRKSGKGLQAVATAHGVSVRALTK
jgi:hypothetical protein